MEPLILVVEDDIELSDVIEKQLPISGIDAQKFSDAEDTPRFLQRSLLILVFLDLHFLLKKGLS
jgi:DNA-binding response OmpR family regulator